MSSSRWAAVVATVALIVGGCVPVRSAQVSPPAPTTVAEPIPPTAVAEPIAPTQVIEPVAPTAVAEPIAPAAAIVAPLPTAVVQTAAPALNDLVVVQTAHGFAAFDWATSRIVYQTPAAVPTSDWSQLVVSGQDGDQSTLTVLDGRTGAQKASIQIPPGLVPGAFSTDGRRVALAPASGDVGREHTQIVVADPSGAVAPRSFDLPGNYEPDAFANDNQHLFVLAYDPPLAPERYSVRSLDLKTGAVGAIGSRSKLPVPEEQMRGTRGMHVLSPDRHMLYTLYTDQPEHLHSRDLAAGLTQSNNDVYAFVHVLNLTDGWAYCLDLPQPFGEGPAGAHALALSADGQKLYVTDRSSGKIALADTNQLTIRRVADVGADPRAATVSAATQIGLSGSLFLSSASAELVVVDPGSLKVQRRLPLPATPTSLAVSPDGRRLFVSTADRLLAIDPMTGAEISGISAEGTPRIEHVGTL